MAAHEAGNDNPYTRGIAEFVSRLEYDAIPEEVRTRVKLLMLDPQGLTSSSGSATRCSVSTRLPTRQKVAQLLAQA